MKSYQTFTTLLIVAVALWVAGCGSTDPAGVSRNTLGGTLGVAGGGLSSQNTTVQSTGGMSCSGNPVSGTSGQPITVTLNVTGGTPPYRLGSITGQSPITAQVVINITSGVTLVTNVPFTVNDSAGRSATCAVRFNVSR